MRLSLNKRDFQPKVGGRASSEGGGRLYKKSHTHSDIIFLKLGFIDIYIYLICLMVRCLG